MGEPTRATRRLLSVREVKERLQVSRPTAYRVMNRLPGRVFIGKSIRVPEEALELFLANGGDAREERATTASVFSERAARATTATTPGSKATQTCSTRTKHWLSKLRSSSGNGAKTRRRKPKQEVND